LRRRHLPPLAVSTDVLSNPQNSTWFVEVFWRRRESL